MVFQEYTAFPWLTVEGNVRFGLREKGLSTGEQHQALEYWLSKTELLEFRSYYPAQLSGGMKQRLALARTLGVEPAILLMDEPFGSLDALTRERIGSFCHKLLRSLELTVLLVTHSIREALLFADHIVVLSGAPAYCKLAVDLHPKASDILDVVESQMSTEIEKRVREALQ
jgi:ABC-type nitrate/sulfonate/bicarbonate transport system ATPase subunit